MRLARLKAIIEKDFKAVPEPMLGMALKSFSVPVSPIRGTSALFYREKPEWLKIVESFDKPADFRPGRPFTLSDEQAALIDNTQPIVDGKPIIQRRQCPGDLVDEMAGQFKLMKPLADTIHWHQPMEFWAGTDDAGLIRFLRLSGTVLFAKTKG